MKNFNFQAMLKHGFLIIPKALLQQQIEDRHMQEGEIEALLKILMKVNYSDTLYNDRQNKNCLCKRGESLFSYRDEYDKWMGVPDSDKQKKKAVNEKFHLFWNEFHSITQLPKENIAKAQREWKKLGDKEQQLAIDRIEEYYFHQTNINFLLHAASYLSNKAFLNEY